MTTADMPGPLDGVRVLDFTNMLSGPYCTRLLADLGADVIKVEPPDGDHNRHRRPVRNGHSSFFGHLNAGKRSVVLDLKAPAGLAAARALAVQCQVVVENWRPGVADRLGVGWANLSEGRGDLVYCSISGFGQEGPLAQRPAYAPILHAASGFDLAQVQYQGADRPPKSATFVADVFGGMSAFAGIQSALYRRATTGRGQYVDVSLLDGMLNLLMNEAQEWQAPTGEPLRLYEPLRTRDGFIIVAPTSQRNFEHLARALGHPEWITDPLFAATRVRESNWSRLMRLIETWSQHLTSAACEDLLVRHGVPCTRYSTVAEAMTSEQVRARGAVSEVEDPAGRYLVPNIPFRMPGLQTHARPRVAGLGEDGTSVLGELLGYDAAQVAACAAAAR